MGTKLLFLSIIFTSLLSAQTYIINDDFENGILGNHPIGWIMKYNGTGTVNQKIVDIPVKNGIKAFQMEGASNWSSEFYQAPTALPNLVTVEAWVNPEKILSGISGSIGLGNYNVGSWGTRTSNVQFVGNRISTQYQDGLVYDIQSYTPGIWYHFKLEHDLTAKTYKVYINGNQVSGTNGSNTISIFPMHPNVASLHVILLAGNSGVVKMLWDDVKVYETKKPIAYYPFNGNANDESGNNLHGTVSGATLTTNRFGNPDSAYSFDGNSVIRIVHDDLLNMDNELSISAWIKPNIQQNAMVLGKSNYSNATNYLLRTNTNNFIEFAHKTRNFSNTNALNIGQWNHVAVISHSTGERKIYINNNLTTFASQNDSYGLVSNELTIGAAFHFGSYFAEYFNGAIDDLIIYKSALTETEIASLFTNNTLNIDKVENIILNNFYIYNNTIYFKNQQDINDLKSVEVYNFLGQKVFKTSKITEQIQLHSLQKGMYILKVKNKYGKQSSLKFLIN